MNYEVYIVQSRSLDCDCRRDNYKIVQHEIFTSFGAMLLWSQGWYKTTGARRTERVEQGRKYQPKAYAAVEYKYNLNWDRLDDFSQFTEAKFVEDYRYSTTDWHSAYNLSAKERAIGLPEGLLMGVEIFRDGVDGVEVLTHYMRIVE